MKTKTITKLISDEHQAVRDYGKKARAVSAPVAKILHHIQGEEKHHAKELGRIKRMKNGINNLGAKSHG